jgi:hypothetical protein
MVPRQRQESAASRRGDARLPENPAQPPFPASIHKVYLWCTQLFFMIFYGTFLKKSSEKKVFTPHLLLDLLVQQEKNKKIT